MKRVFNILTFPLYLIYLLVSFPFKIVKIIISDKIEKRRNTWIKDPIKRSNKEIIEMGQFLYPQNPDDYTMFTRSYLIDKKAFLIKNKVLLANYDNFNLEKLKPIEVIYIFGDSKEKLLITDWRGEENEREIEQFLEDKLQIKTNWKNTNRKRKSVNEERQREGEFIIDLLKAIDKDLETVNKRLIFLDLDWDAYVYTAIDKSSYDSITAKYGALLHGTEKLSK